jgi:hypothetical protein
MRNDVDTVIRQVLIQTVNGKVSDFYDLITAEYEPDMYTREDDYITARKRVQHKAETARFVHLYAE